MNDFAPTVNDLALYFCDDHGSLAKHWVTKPVYMSEPCKFDKAWHAASLLECSIESGGVFYVVNLSKLIGPGQSPVPAEPIRFYAIAPKEPQLQAPGRNDLVVIPPDGPEKAYVVRREVYTNPDLCPPIGKRMAEADLDFMALNQGTVLSNLPKTTATSGWTCFLLSLISLKSGALPGINSDDRNSYFAAISHKYGVQGTVK